MKSLPVPQVILAVQVLFLVILFQPATGAKILFVVGNVNSHVLFFARLADDLARLGHVTELLVASNARKPDFVLSNRSHANFSYTGYPVDGDVPFANSPEVSESLMRVALSRSLIEQFQLISTSGARINDALEADCARLLGNDQLMSRIRSEGFQFAIMDPIVIHCFYVVPYSLDIRYATLSVPLVTWFYRVPRLPSFFSSLIGYTDRMSFSERLKTLTYELATWTLMMNSSTYYVEKFAADKPPLKVLNLIERMSAWFLLEDIAVSYALPHMPNTVAVGDIMAGRPGRPISTNLDNFMAAATGGVIVVSFGSFFDYVPSDVVEKFCDAFNRLGSKGQRIIWKYKNSEACRDGENHIKIMSWIPQNDLLADPRVRLFVTHGGLNSLIEAVYHAKPVIVFPIAFDQRYNAAAAESKEFALRMDIGNFTVDCFLANIDEILSNPKYERNARLSSEIMHNRRDTPAERVSHLIEEILKYGDSHLRSGAFDLHVLQFFMFDLFAFVFTICMLIAVVVTCICYRCCRLFRKCARKSISNETGQSKAKLE